MKSLKKYIIVMIASVGIITSCKDESLQVVPEWETGVHGFATVTSANSDLLYNDPAVDVDIDLKWISIDGKVRTKFTTCIRHQHLIMEMGQSMCLQILKNPSEMQRNGLCGMMC